MASKVRPLLIGTTGGLLLLTAVTGIAALVAVAHARSAEAALRSRYLQRNAALEELRGGIYLSGTLARDYFADPGAPEAAALIARLTQLEAATQRDAAGQGNALRGEITAYWKVLDLMGEMARNRRTPGVDAYFRRQLAQRRENMLSIAGDIGTALESQWRHGEAEIDLFYRRLRWILGSELLLVVSLGVFLSVWMVRRLVRLEGGTRALGLQLVRAQEDERRSISRELHDEVGQALSGLLLDVGKASSMAEAAETRARLQSISALAERCVEEVRRIALALRPSMLDDLGLAAALEWQARELGRRTGLNIEVHADEDAAHLSDAQRTCIYRIAQEALQNCARHSGATRVRVALGRAASTVSLRVEDDGRGFQPARTRGLGILGMEERVAQMGGHFRVVSIPGGGTTVTAELPV